MTVSPGSSGAVQAPAHRAAGAASGDASSDSARSSSAGADATAGKGQGPPVSVKVLQVPEPEDRGPEHLLPSYPNLINYPRLKGSALRCVMCGLEPSNEPDSSVSAVCIIPRQNKDVCRDCDSSVWMHLETGALFKWCKGCKRFLAYSVFGEKVEAAKCERCRERGRRSYMARKRRASMDETLLERPSPANNALTPSQPVEGRSRAYSHSHLPSPDSESSAEADEMDSLDSVQQWHSNHKLSSLFGHPLKRVRAIEDASSTPPRPRAASESHKSTPSPATPAASAEPEVSNNPLYDLVAVHHHIMTLEETADQVNTLSKELANKTDLLVKYKAEVDQLRQQLKIVQDRDHAHELELQELRSKNQWLHSQQEAWRQREKQFEAELALLMARQASSQKRPQDEALASPVDDVSLPTAELELETSRLKAPRVV